MESNKDLGTSNLTAKVLSSLDAWANQVSACPAHGPHDCSHCCQKAA